MLHEDWEYLSFWEKVGMVLLWLGVIGIGALAVYGVYIQEVSK